MSHLPMMPFFPNKYNKPNPTTVGGRTKGSKKNASTTFVPMNVWRAIIYAKNTPVKNTTTVEIPAVLSDNHNGKKSISAICHPPITHKQTRTSPRYPALFQCLERLKSLLLPLSLLNPL